jgi:hypothetical protein
MFSGVSKKQREQAEAKKVLAEVTQMLRDESLTPEQREELQRHAYALAGELLRPWLPTSWWNIAAMIAIFAFGLERAIVGNFEAMAWWIVLPAFSPRVAGEAAFVFGRLFRSRDHASR